MYVQTSMKSLFKNKKNNQIFVYIDLKLLYKVVIADILQHIHVYEVYTQLDLIDITLSPRNGPYFWRF